MCVEAGSVAGRGRGAMTSICCTSCCRPSGPRRWSGPSVPPWTLRTFPSTSSPMPWAAPSPNSSTNRSPLTAWGSVLQDHDLAEAIVDRALERGGLLVLDSPSYRTRHLPLDSSNSNDDQTTKPARISGTRTLTAIDPANSLADNLLRRHRGTSFAYSSRPGHTSRTSTAPDSGRNRRSNRHTGHRTDTAIILHCRRVPCVFRRGG